MAFIRQCLLFRQSWGRGLQYSDNVWPDLPILFVWVWRQYVSNTLYAIRLLPSALRVWFLPCSEWILSIVVLFLLFIFMCPGHVCNVANSLRYTNQTDNYASSWAARAQWDAQYSAYVSLIETERRSKASRGWFGVILVLVRRWSWRSCIWQCRSGV